MHIEQSSQDKVTGVFKFYFGEFPFKCLPLLLEDFEHVRPCLAGCKRFAHLAGPCMVIEMVVAKMVVGNPKSTNIGYETRCT